MVVFTCSYCGESLKKGAVGKHYDFKCRGRTPFLTCVDCLKDFKGNDYDLHTSCVTEAERYSAKGFVSNRKGEEKQKAFQKGIENLLNLNTLLPDERELLEIVVDKPNIPMKQKPFLNFICNGQGGKYKANSPSTVNLVDRVWNHIQQNVKAGNQKTNSIDTDKDSEIKNGERKDEGSGEKSKKSKKERRESTRETKSTEMEIEEKDSKKKKKKSKKNKANDEENVSKKDKKRKNEETTTQEEDISEKSNVKKSKIEIPAEETNANDSKIKKKKRKHENDLEEISEIKKSKQEIDIEVAKSKKPTNQNPTENEKKQKKNKKKDENTLLTDDKNQELNQNNKNQENGLDEISKSKKSKKEIDNEETKSKKSKKRANENPTLVVNGNHMENEKKQKKKDESVLLVDNKQNQNGENGKKFPWNDAILTIINKKGTDNQISLKKLEKKLIKAYKKANDNQEPVRVHRTLLKKLKKLPQVSVEQEQVVLKS